jgi:hypothetical protein
VLAGPTANRTDVAAVAAAASRTPERAISRFPFSSRDIVGCFPLGSQPTHDRRMLASPVAPCLDYRRRPRHNRRPETALQHLGTGLPLLITEAPRHRGNPPSSLEPISPKLGSSLREEEVPVTGSEPVRAFQPHENCDQGSKKAPCTGRGSLERLCADWPRKTGPWGSGTVCSLRPGMEAA